MEPTIPISDNAVNYPAVVAISRLRNKSDVRDNLTYCRTRTFVGDLIVWSILIFFGCVSACFDGEMGPAPNIVLTDLSTPPFPFVLFLCGDIQAP